MASIPIVNFVEKRGDTLDYVATFTGIDLTVSGTKVWFTGKTSKADADLTAIWQKTVGAGIVVNSATQATLTLQPTDSAPLSDGAIITYDVQAKTPAGRIQTAFEGTITFESDVTLSTT